jgi:flavin reductase (DIM6/NTAB) family NADH-FMN oxidoreductase RutF
MPDKGAVGDGDGVLTPDDFKEAMARWVAGVTVVAVRDPDDGRVYGTTVSSLASLSAEPPRIFFSLGPGAQVLPFIGVDARFVVNILGEEQRRLAQVFSDPFPVGPSPFPAEGPPVIADAHVSLTCEAERLVEVDPGRIVVGRVMAARVRGGSGPLIRYLREYRRLGE